MDLNIDGWRISVGGDPDGGWIIDIHDGKNHGVYSPAAGDAEAAKAAAIDAHKQTFLAANTATAGRIAVGDAQSGQDTALTQARIDAVAQIQSKATADNVERDGVGTAQSSDQTITPVPDSAALTESPTPADNVHNDPA